MTVNKRYISRSTVLTVFIFILCFVFLSEAFSRYLWPYNSSLRRISQGSSNPKILFELKPGTSVVFAGQYIRIPKTTISISSLGTRDHEYPVHKPQGVYRIIILGDSVAFGWGVQMEQTFPKRLESLLASDGKYEVMNFAVPGYNTVQEVETLKSKCLAYSPDLVIFHVRSNDYFPLFDYLYPLPVLKHLPAVLYKSHLFNAVVTRLVMHADKRMSLELGRGLPEAGESIKELKTIMAENNIKVLFYPDIDWIRAILAKEGLGQNIVSSQIIDSRPGYTIEDGHPTAATHRLMAQEIYRYLKEKGFLKQ